MKELYERWLPVVGYEGLYEVSNHGRVRSLDHWANSRPGVKKLMRGRVLRFAWHNRGYATVCLSREGKVKRRLVAHLVAEAFIGPRPEGKNVLHGPLGNKSDHLSNLSYGTQAQNIGPDRQRDGTTARGRAKLNEISVRKCRLAYQKGETVTRLAELHNVTPETIRAAIKLRTWKHVS